VLYTGWDPDSERLGDELIPFAQWDEAITVVRSPTDLGPAVRTAARPDESAMDARREVIEEFLGPIDGRASERTLEIIRTFVDEFADARTPEMNALRERLARERPPLRVGRRALVKLDGARGMLRSRLGR
jgi:hypothetical protein